MINGGSQGFSFHQSALGHWGALTCLVNQTWSIPEPNSGPLIHVWEGRSTSPGLWWGKGGLYCRRQARSSGSQSLKTPGRPEGSQEKVFKHRVKDGCCGVCDQSVGILLIGWWWGDRASSTFWFQPVWGVCACEQCAGNFLHFKGVGAPVSAKQLTLNEPTGSSFSAVQTLPRDSACLWTISVVLAIAISITAAAGNSIRKKGHAVEVSNK